MLVEAEATERPLQSRLTFKQPQNVTSDGCAMPIRKPFCVVLHSQETSRVSVGVWQAHLAWLN